jgi:hypothetical protein
MILEGKGAAEHTHTQTHALGRSLSRLLEALVMDVKGSATGELANQRVRTTD